MKTRFLFLFCLLFLLICCSAYADEVTLTFGKQAFSASSDATEIDLGEMSLPNKDEAYEALEDFLLQIPGLTKVDMFSTDITQARLESLAEKFPQIHFGWTILIPCKNTLRPDRGPHRLRTDDTAFSTQHNVSSTSHGSEVWEVLKYCPNLLALDLGHNNSINDISFLRYVPNLKVLIFSFNRNQRGQEGTPLDISPIGELKDLEYLEICKSNIADISPLANCTQLVDLNISTNHISDLTPLQGLTHLRRLYLFSCQNYSESPIPKSEEMLLKECLPDCDINNTSINCGGMWRKHHRYDTLALMFSYQLPGKPQSYIPFDNLD